MKASVIRIARWLALSLFATTMLFSRQIAYCLKDRNRFYLFWERADGAALVADILVISILAVAAVWILQSSRFSSWRRAVYHLHPLAIGMGLIGFVPYFPARSLTLAALWTLLALIVFLCYRANLKLVEVSRYVSLTCFLIVPLLLYQLIAASAHPSPAETLPRATGAANRPPVYIFLFDGWSYARSSREGRFLPGLTNIRQLSAQSIQFTNAHSLGDFTVQAVPRLLFQTRGTFDIRTSGMWMEDEGKSIPSRDATSIFGLARERGYSTAALGFYFPYRRVIGNQVDYSRSFSLHSYTEPGDPFWKRMEYGLRENLSNWPDPISRVLDETVENRRRIERWKFVDDSLFAGLNRLLADWPDSTFAFFHWNLPHEPFVFDAHGKPRARPRTDMDSYLDQIHYVDRRIGQIAAALKRANRFDEALVIITSDHAHRREPSKDIRSQPNWVTHVPLIVKWPRQTHGRVVTRGFSHIELGELLELAMDSAPLDRAMRTPSASTAR